MNGGSRSSFRLGNFGLRSSGERATERGRRDGLCSKTGCKNRWLVHMYVDAI